MSASAASAAPLPSSSASSSSSSSSASASASADHNMSAAESAAVAAGLGAGSQGGDSLVHGPSDIARALTTSSTYVFSEGSALPPANTSSDASADNRANSASASAAGDSSSASAGTGAAAPPNRRAMVPLAAAGAAFPCPSPLLPTAGADLARYPHAEAARLRELRGMVEFRLVWNNGLPEHMIALIGAKDIFAAQLPNMPKEYVARHVLDRNHRTIVLITERGVIGGICFRPFYSQRFAEIVFCAITSSEQVKGYGSRIMNHLKEHVKTEGIEFFLTYADNFATEYFRKQGFTKHLSMPVERWKGWIKDYDGSTLMECRINRRVNYLDVPSMVTAQREAVFARIKQVSNTHAIFPGLTFGRDKRPYRIEDIPGVLEAGWRPGNNNCVVGLGYGDSGAQAGGGSQQTPPQPGSGSGSAGAGSGSGAGASGTVSLGPAVANPTAVDPDTGLTLIELVARLGAVLKGIKATKDAWPFAKPVDARVVTDYYTLIAEPMDLAEMTRRMNTGFYTSKQLFERDMALVVGNCRRYNAPMTTYYRCADAVEVAFKRLMAQQFTATASSATDAAAANGDADGDNNSFSSSSCSSASASAGAGGVRAGTVSLVMDD